MSRVDWFILREIFVGNSVMLDSAPLSEQDSSPIKDKTKSASEAVDVKVEFA